MSSLYPHFFLFFLFFCPPVPNFSISGCLTFSLAAVSFPPFNVISLFWVPMYLTTTSSLPFLSDVLETYYRPTSFMRLSLTTCQPLFEELLLVLQPLSLLTFNLDLLFQHHHLEPDSHSPDIHSPPCQDATSQLSTEDSKSKNSRFIESLSEVDFGSPERALPLANPKNLGSGESSQYGAAPVKASVRQVRSSCGCRRRKSETYLLLISRRTALLSRQDRYPPLIFTVQCFNSNMFVLSCRSDFFLLLLL